MMTAVSDSRAVAPAYESVSLDDKVFGECLKEALLPHLQHFPRNEVLKIQLDTVKTDAEKFPVLLELLKLKIEELKQSGISCEAYIKELKQHLEGKLLFEGDNSALKNELLVLTGFTYTCARKSRGIDAHLKLFELEKETGFALDGSDHLVSQVVNDIAVFYTLTFADLNRKIKIVSGVVQDVPFLGEALVRIFEIFKQSQKNQQTPSDLYWNTVFPNFKKVVELLEKEQDIERIQKVFKMYIPCLHVDLQDSTRDPLAQALPYIAKYGSLENIEPYFNQRYKEKTPWDKAYLWVDLHCQVAELLATTDKAKAQDLLAKADKQKPVLTFSLFHRVAQRQKLTEAEARIAAARAKVG
jgi:hypothetical protein